MAKFEFTEADLAEILDECTPRARLLIVHLLERVSKLEQRVVDLESQLSNNNRRSGGQAGHEGQFFNLVEKPDYVFLHQLIKCDE
jgi:hypothetical protein